MKRFLRLALALSATVVLVLWVDSPGLRHGMVPPREQACAVNQFLNLPTDVDLFVIGSSRIRESVDPEQLRAASEGRIRNPVNFGRSGIGAERNYSLLNDLLARGASPNWVIVEVDLDALMSNDDAKTIPVQPDAGFQEFSTIIRSFSIHQKRSAIERVHNVALKLLTKLRAALVYSLSGDTFQHQMRSIRSEHFEARCKLKGYDVRRPVHIRRYEASIQEFEKLFGPSWSTAEDDRFSLGDTVYANIELFYLEQMRQLAAQKQIQFIVTRMWKAGQPPLSLAALSRIRAIIPEFVYPSAEHVRGSWENFIDGTHLNPKGREVYSQWLAEEVSRRPTF